MNTNLIPPPTLLVDDTIRRKDHLVIQVWCGPHTHTHIHTHPHMHTNVHTHTHMHPHTHTQRRVVDDTIPSRDHLVIQVRLRSLLPRVKEDASTFLQDAADHIHLQAKLFGRFFQSSGDKQHDLPLQLIMGVL